MNSDDISRRRAGLTVAKAVLHRVTPRQKAVAALQEAEGKAKRPDKRPFRYAITYRLSKPLDVLIDVVTVTQIATTLTFGDAKLKA